jgi:ElaB/YqjD/DUF883 family membrane-anchored ribosome-binding protein
MGQSAEQLRREIEYTRGDLGETLDAIGDRLSPGRIMERRKNRLVSGLRSVRERVMGSASDAGTGVGQPVREAAEGAVDTVKDAPDMVRRQTEGNPLVAGGIAVGVGVLIASMFPATQQEQRAAERLLDKAEPLKDELRQAGQQMAEDLREPAREAVQELKDAASEGTQAVSESAKDAAQTTSRTAREAADDLRAEVSGDTFPPPQN